MNFGAAMQGEEDIKKGPWYEEEDELLTSFVTLLGDRRWDSIAKVSGLKRSGKSCRLRWKNYLRPNLKRSKITAEEESVIFQLHGQFGNKWARIARSLPGRTDNEIKNYWRTHMKKKPPPPPPSTSAEEEQSARNGTYNASVEECDGGNIEVKVGTSWDSAMGSSDLTSWLYGTRELSDWRMSEMSNNDQSLELLGDYNCIESSLSTCPAWVTDNSCDTNLWDFSCYQYDVV